MSNLEFQFTNLTQLEAPLDVRVKKILQAQFGLDELKPHAPLVNALDQLANLIEISGSFVARQGGEPDYHNRNHAFEVLAALGLLLAQEDILESAWSLAWPSFTMRQRLLMMIAALGHDALHPGGVNETPHQLENMSARVVTKLLTEQGIDVEDRIFVEGLILATEFDEVGLIHDRLNNDLGGVFELELRAAVLITEADVLPSVLPDHGRRLGELLAREWRKAKVATREDPSLPEVRKKFLRRVRFSSPHAQSLGIKALIDQQLLV